MPNLDELRAMLAKMEFNPDNPGRSTNEKLRRAAPALRALIAAMEVIQSVRPVHERPDLDNAFVSTAEVAHWDAVVDVTDKLLAAMNAAWEETVDVRQIIEKAARECEVLRRENERFRVQLRVALELLNDAAHAGPQNFTKQKYGECAAIIEHVLGLTEEMDL